MTSSRDIRRSARRRPSTHRFTAVLASGALSLGALGLLGATAPSAAAPEEDEAVRSAADAIVVPHVDDVRGNLTLPTTGLHGATISWASDDPAVVTPTGEVTRPVDGDATVRLTATVTLDGATATRTLEAAVRDRPAPEPLEGYAFAHMLGEGSPTGEQIYVAMSKGNSPLSWVAVNDHRPVLTSKLGERGVRDPFLVRSPEGDRFYLIATDLKINGNGNWDRAQRWGSRSILVWESTDLVNWSEQRLVEVSPERAGNTWAPEIIYDETTGEYVVLWASKIYDNDEHTGNPHQRMMYAKTRDFRTFTEAREYLNPGYSVIDTTMVEHDGRMYRFTKDERNASSTVPYGKHVFQEVGDSVFDPDFTMIRRGVGASSDPRVGIRRGEGPTVFKSNTEEKWYAFIDEYGSRGYVPFETTDLDSGEWTMVQGITWPGRPRHGDVVPVSAIEHARLMSTAPQECTRTLTGEVAGPLEVTSGVVCLDAATVTDGVTVGPGASLVVNGGRIAGGLTTEGARVVALADVRVTGGARVRGTTGWVRLSGSEVSGTTRVTGSTSTVAPDLRRTTVTGNLACTGNATTPLLDGARVTGRASGQCAG